MAEVPQDADGGETAQVGHEDGGPLGRVEQSAPRVEMAVPPGGHVLLGNSRGRAGDVGEDVPVPADGLLQDYAQEKHDGGILADFIKGLDGGVDLLGVLAPQRRDVVEILLDVVGIDVMATMGRLPREVGGEEPGMQNEADGVVERAPTRKAAVAAVVRDHPQTCPDEALAESIDIDNGVVEPGRLDNGGGVQQLVEGGRESGAVAEIAREIEERPKEVGREAVFGDCAAQVVDGDVFFTEFLHRHPVSLNQIFFSISSLGYTHPSFDQLRRVGLLDGVEARPFCLHGR